MIIRGVALAAVGVAASVLAVNEFSDRPGTPSDAARIAAAPDAPDAPSPKADATTRTDARMPLAIPDLPEMDHAEADALPGDRPAMDAQMAQRDMAETIPQPPDCAPSLQLDVFVDGLIDLSFTATLSDQGRYATYLPALAQEAQIRVHLDDGTALQRMLFVPEAAEHHRVVLHWAGDLGVGLHGYHHGAAYGDSGHIHATKPFDPDLEGAFLIRLGEGLSDTSQSAEIYSIPAAHRHDTRLELELRHDARSCGRDIALDVVQASGDGDITLKPLVVVMPDCAEEDSLVVLPIRLDPAMPLHLSMTTQ